MGRGRRRPQRSPLARPLGGWATVRDRLDDVHYMISIGSRISMAVIGFYSGARPLVKGERVVATWREEARLWHIQGVGKALVAATEFIPVAGTDDGSWAPVGETSTMFTTVLSANRHRGTSGFNNRTWTRIPSVTVAQGETIVSAVLTATGDVSNRATVEVDIFGNLATDAVSPVSRADADAKARTTAFIEWNAAHPGDGIIFTLGDVTVIVQEIVDQGGWVSGNAMMFLFDTVPNVGGALPRDTKSLEGIAGSEIPVTLTLTQGSPTTGPTEELMASNLSDFEEI